jgi:HEPN domain-containing protein
MTPSAKEWVEKAEADHLSAGREYRARNRPNYDASCFFAQQCAEKYLKARLVEEGIAFPKTHDLEALLDMILSKEPLWETLRQSLVDITSYAVAFRYPGESATREMARTALTHAKRLRQEVRQSLGLTRC